MGSPASRSGSFSLSTKEKAHTPKCVARLKKICTKSRAHQKYLSSYFAPFVCYTSFRAGRRHSLGADDAWALRHFHHPNLYTCEPGKAPRSVQEVPPAILIE